MDLGTLHLILNMHHLVGGTVDLDSQIRKVMNEVNYPSKQTGAKSENVTDTTIQSSQSTSRKSKVVASCSKENCKNKNAPRNTSSKGTSENISHKNSPRPFSNQSVSFKVPRSVVSTGSTKQTVSNIHSEEEACPRPCLKRGHTNALNEHEEPSAKVRKETSPGSSIQNSACKRISTKTAQETAQYDDDTLEKIVQTLVKAQTIFDVPIEIKEKEESSSSSNSQPSHGRIPEVKGGRDKPQEVPHEVSGMEMILQVTEQRVVQMVKFTKKIPGLANLDVEDVLSLLKSSKSESQMIQSKVYDASSQTVQVKGASVSKVDLAKYLPKGYLTQRAKIDEKLLCLHLTEREAAVIRAVIITYPDRATLKDRNSVGKLHNQMRACLHYVILQIGYENDAARLKEIDDVLLFIRNMTEEFNNGLEEVFKNCNLLQNYGFAREFMNM